MAVKKVHYNGSSKIIKALCKAVNDIIDSGGGGGDTVTITPTLLSGTKIADYTINGVADELYSNIEPFSVVGGQVCITYDDGN